MPRYRPVRTASMHAACEPTAGMAAAHRMTAAATAVAAAATATRLRCRKCTPQHRHHNAGRQKKFSARNGMHG
jgi:hypothetical protein